MVEKINLHTLGLPTSAGEPWLRRAFQNGNASVATFDKVMEGLALAISGQMRSENVTANYFTPPVAGRRSEWGGDWKSSSLPLLFNAPLNDKDMGASKSLKVADMEERASLLKFKLVQDSHESPSEGWRLHKVAELPPRKKKSRKDKKLSMEAQEPRTTVEQPEPLEDQSEPRVETRQNTVPRGHEWV
ncbi:hypothetical protein MCOR04_005995 [Pyricularia oryzae]|nr:hypothetical protein MCOR04_005995 [Pyricularia oryzae]